MENTDQSPYLAGVAGKTGDEAALLEKRIDALPEKLKDILFDSGINDTIRGMGTQIPEQLIPVIVKMAFFLIMGDAPFSQVGALLQRAGLSPEQASAAVTALTPLSHAIEVSRREPQPELPKPTPPLTVRRPAVGPPPRPPAIIDLRKQQP